MSLSKYPEKLDLFQYKINAEFEGDPNGSDVMAEDINELQDAILAIENALGVNPQGNKLSVGERITLLEGSSSLRVPSFLLYLGNPESINGSQTTDEAIGHYTKYDHIVLGNNADDISDTDHQLVIDIISGVKANRDVKIYGYINCSVNTVNLSLSELQVKIQSWKDMGATGIYCANFSFESGVDRARQNDILDSIHQYGMVAILQANNPDEVFSDLYHETMNPNWVAPAIQDGDTFHYDKFVVDTSSTDIYTDFVQTVTILKKLYGYRNELGVRIFATPLIRSDVTQATAQKYYDYAHAAALLGSVDAFYPVQEGYGELTSLAPTYDWTPIAGSWYVNNPKIEVNSGSYARETPFGRITLDTAAHTYEYDGIYIPFSLLKITANTIDGSLLKDASIEDKKIKNYDGKRLISSINNSDGTEKIAINKIGTFSYGDISGAISVDALKANVIEAINAYIGTAVIDEAFIGDLHANHITAGTIDAERITASVVQAINMFAGYAEIGSAYIHGAIIDNLEAKSIKAGTIDAERIKASVIEAINLSADQANIKNLNADNITTGNLKAERIQAEVINAINLYAESAIVDKAVINSAAVGEMTVEHLKGNVIEAVNLSAENAVIKGAKIEEASITTAHIVNGSITNAKIGDAAIDTANIKLGAITSALIGEQQVGEANIELGSITDALIKNLSADKINAGKINTAYVSVQGPDGLLRINANRLQVFDRSQIPVERVSIGDVNGDGTAYGFRVRGADGVTVLYDEKGVYNEGITDGAITNPKIGNNAIDERVIAADAIFARHIIADAIQSDHIMADAINSRHILAGTISAGSAIIAEGAIGRAQLATAIIGEAQIENGVITNAHIKDLNADKINAGKVKAQFLEIGADTSFSVGYDPTQVNSSIRNDLRLTSPLPSYIKMDNTGITVTTPSDATKYVKLDHRGLYISNGAIIIEGGLGKDNIDSDVTDQWDSAVQFSEDMADDNVITVAEKKMLKKDWDGFQAEHTALMGQADYYWATNPPASKATCVARFGELKDYLTVQVDLNNNKPILAVDNMWNASTVVGTTLSDRLLGYKNAKWQLEQDIAKKSKDLADAAQENIDEVEGKIVYKVEVLSTKGNVFKNGQVDTILEAVVYYGPDNITEEVQASQLIWTRSSANEDADAAWNEAHKGGAKTITITQADIFMKASFKCDLLI